jgi:hypothetical protein
MTNNVTIGLHQQAEFRETIVLHGGWGDCAKNTFFKQRVLTHHCASTQSILQIHKVVCEK